ncbi:MAG: HD-GYP domain-containing protein [Desulfobulbaceae bacterium]|nr:HD-GYP domain-containing protein [Desulfobulbaceae bacterium]
MTISTITSAVLILLGIILMSASIVLGRKMTRSLPAELRSNWIPLLCLMTVFLLGYIGFLPLLGEQTFFPQQIFSSLILFGGSIFVFLVISFTRSTIAKIKADEDQLKKNNILLAEEVRVRRAAEEQIRRQSDMMMHDILEIVAEMIANRDQYTFEHAAQVARIGGLIGREMKLSDDDLKAIEFGCLVHDIGKTAIPDDVLLKPGNFDPQDRFIMQYHPLVGAKIFARHLQDDRITNIILNHHERLDGSGYPSGLKGDEIDLFSRITAVADTYESLVSRRPYKQPMSRDKALAIVDKEAKAGQLDQDIVNLLKKIAPEIPEDIAPPRQVTAGFMKNIELFRRKTYFREPLTDFYNYRYLYFLNDAQLLKNNILPYDLFLVDIRTFGEFQQKTGHVVADQILDELGHSLLKTTTEWGSEQESGSVMLFRKGNDYLLYGEFADDKNAAAFMKQIKGDLAAVKREWELASTLYRQNFPAGFPMDKALASLFAAPSNSLQTG